MDGAVPCWLWELVPAGASSHSSPRYLGVSFFAKGWFPCKLSLYSFNLSELKYTQTSWLMTKTQTSTVKLILIKSVPNTKTNLLVTPLQVRLCHLTLQWLRIWACTPPLKANIWALWTSPADGVSWPTAETLVKALCNQPLPQKLCQRWCGNCSCSRQEGKRGH